MRGTLLRRCGTPRLLQHLRSTFEQQYPLDAEDAFDLLRHHIDAKLEPEMAAVLLCSIADCRAPISPDNVPSCVNALSNIDHLQDALSKSELFPADAVSDLTVNLGLHFHTKLSLEWSVAAQSTHQLIPLLQALSKLIEPHRLTRRVLKGFRERLMLDFERFDVRDQQQIIRWYRLAEPQGFMRGHCQCLMKQKTTIAAMSSEELEFGVETMIELHSMLKAAPSTTTPQSDISDDLALFDHDFLQVDSDPRLRSSYGLHRGRHHTLDTLPIEFSGIRTWLLAAVSELGERSDVEAAQLFALLTKVRDVMGEDKESMAKVRLTLRLLATRHLQEPNVDLGTWVALAEALLAYEVMQQVLQTALIDVGALHIQKMSSSEIAIFCRWVCRKGGASDSHLVETIQQRLSNLSLVASFNECTLLLQPSILMLCGRAIMSAVVNRAEKRLEEASFRELHLLCEAMIAVRERSDTIEQLYVTRLYSCLGMLGKEQLLMAVKLLHGWESKCPDLAIEMANRCVRHVSALNLDETVMLLEFMVHNGVFHHTLTASIAHCVPTQITAHASSDQLVSVYKSLLRLTIDNEHAIDMDGVEAACRARAKSIALSL